MGGETLGTIRGDDEVDGIEEPQPYELTLRLRSLQSQLAVQAGDTIEFLECVLQKGFRIQMGPRLDVYCQRMLSLCGSFVNLSNCPTKHGNILHAAAKYGLAESAKEALAQGYYNMLLELDHNKPSTWPLYYAVGNQEWPTVKIFLETLNSSQCQSQIRTMLHIIDCEKVIKEVRDYQKPWWVINSFHHEDLEKRLEVEGKSLLVKAVLDTTLWGSDIDPSLLLVHNDNVSSDEIDSGTAIAEEKLLYNLISDSNVETLKGHPSFAACVQHKWRQSYVYFHGILSVLYMVYLILLTVALVLAARSPDPRQYNDGNDYLRLCFEIVAFLYILTVIIIDSTVLIGDCCTHYKKKEGKHCPFLIYMVSIYACFEVVRYLSTLLIIPLRIADSSFQWQVVSLAIILSGFRLFRYATVFPLYALLGLICVGEFFQIALFYFCIVQLVRAVCLKYEVSWVPIIMQGAYFHSFWELYCVLVSQIFGAVHWDTASDSEKDLPRLFIVFAVINFSFGTGLYFSLLGHYNNENVDIINDNSTSKVYLLWMTGVQTVIEGSVLTYNGRGGFNFSGRLIYWLFVFCVSVVFAAILIAQFQTSYQHLASKAYLNVILKRAEIMRKMDRIFAIFMWLFKHIPCMKSFLHSFKQKSCGEIRREATENRENIDPKDYIVEKLSRKLAENDKRVQMLESKLDKIHELLLSRK